MTDYEILYNLTLCIIGAPTVFSIIFLMVDGIKSRKSHR